MSSINSSPTSNSSKTVSNPLSSPYEKVSENKAAREARMNSVCHEFPEKTYVSKNIPHPPSLVSFLATITQSHFK